MRRNYTGSRNGYPDHVKQKAIKYYLEGNGFRRIEILMHFSHVSVINWVKKVSAEIRKREKRRLTKTNILELDEMCISFKKNMALDGCKHNNRKAYRFLCGESNL